MLLVLTIVASTLMGVMMVDVSAVKVTGGAGEDLNNRVWDVNMLSSGTDYTVRSVMGTGKWVLYPSKVAEGGQESYDLGTVDLVQNLGKEYWHMNLNSFTYKEGDSTNLISANYMRFETDGTNPGVGQGATDNADTKSTKIATADFNSTVCGTTAEDGAVTYGNVLKYTFYAYSKKADGQFFTIQLSNPSSSLGTLELKASDLYSPNGIPHRVDVYVWSNSVDGQIAGANVKDPATNNANEAIYYAAVLDGSKTLSSNYCQETAKNLNTATKNVAIQPYLHFQPTNKASYDFPGGDWYVSHDGNIGFEAKTRANFSEESFRNFTIKDTYSKVADGKAWKSSGDKSNVVTGVDATVATELNTVLPKNAGGVDKEISLKPKYYNNPAAMFTGEETNVKIVDRVTGAEVAVADATSTMDDYYLMVNGVYVKVNPWVFETVVDTGKSVFSPSHNTVTTRVYQEDYVKNAYTDDKPFGGLTSGFYRYTNEPRSGMAFSNGGSMYKSDGYVALKVNYSNEADKNYVLGKATALETYNLNVNKVTAEYVMYFPEATSGYHMAIATKEGTTRKNQSTLYFRASDKDTRKGNNYVDVIPNAWNTIAIQFDQTNVEADGGNFTINVFVNGEFATSYKSSSGNYTEQAKENLILIDYLRFYSPTYIPYGVLGGGRWYLGEYTPKATEVAASAITTTDAKIDVDEESLIIASGYATEEETIAALSGYTPVYVTTVNTASINDKYDAVDGTVTDVTTEEKKKDSTVQYAYKGEVIKRWIENSGVFEITKGENGAIDTYTTTKALIAYARDNGDGTATIAFNGKFGDATAYPGVCTMLKDLVAMDPTLVSHKLIGFAVNEEGKLPKIYTLAESGLELRSLTYNKEAAQAELTYREFNATAEDSYTFQLVVAAYNSDGKMLSLKIDISKTITGEGPDGTNVVTFAPDFAEDVLTETAFYKVFAFETFVGGKAIISSAKVYK